MRRSAHHLLGVISRHHHHHLQCSAAAAAASGYLARYSSSNSSSSSSSRSRFEWGAWTTTGKAASGAAAAAAAGVAAAFAATAAAPYNHHQFTAAADAFDEANAAAAADDDGGGENAERLRAEFYAWLRANGGDMPGAALGASRDPAAGAGLLSTRGLRAATRAPFLGRRLGAFLTRQLGVPAVTVPLGLAFTAAAAVDDPDLGPSYAELLHLGLLDERSAVVAMLAVERARGDGSRYAPYIRLLPRAFPTPLWWDEEQLNELRGTPLAAAVRARRRLLEAQWRRLGPALADMAAACGAERAPTYDDFLWANSVFWSRGQSLPVPAQARRSARGFAGDDDDNGEAFSSSSSSSSSSKRGDGADDYDGSDAVVVFEGVVPGIDFANHSAAPNCWWDVSADTGSRSSGRHSGGGRAVASGPTVRLMASRPRMPKRAGGELTISYGDKSNEELLMLYGFAVDGNPHDVLMLACPLPPRGEWGDDTFARLALLQARGLRPQLFLSAARLDGGGGGGGGKGKRSSGGRRVGGPGSALPPEGAAVLTAFTSDLAEVMRELAAAEEEARALAAADGDSDAIISSSSSSAGEAAAQPQASSLSSSAEAASARVEALGADMALITTLVRLLELKVLELEGLEEGTGPLEDDEAALAAAAATGSDGGGGGGAAALPAWRRAALLYRAGQKRLARRYLEAARGELAETLRALQAAVDEEAAAAAAAAAASAAGAR